MEKLHQGRLIDHMHLRVADLEASRSFYRAALDSLGRRFTSESPTHFSCDELWVDRADGPVPRVHLAFQAVGRDYFAAFVLDPDGNNIEAVFHGPATRSADSAEVMLSA
jgi:catechol 2,3-dioxygenase-like lactoylglutathione lyase family enzyme